MYSCFTGWTERMPIVALMNRRIHWISTNWTFKKFMDTGGARINNRSETSVIIIAVIVRLWNRRKLMGAMVMDLILISQIWGWHTFNAMQFHSYNRKRTKIHQVYGKFVQGYDSIGAVESTKRRRRWIYEQRGQFCLMGMIVTCKIASEWWVFFFGGGGGVLKNKQRIWRQRIQDQFESAYRKEFNLREVPFFFIVSKKEKAKHRWNCFESVD